MNNNTTIDLTNNTITRNSCTGSPSTNGGGVYSCSTTTVIGLNNIIYDNIAINGPEWYVDFGATILLNYSDCPQALTGTGNITDNPQFNNPNIHEFSLQSISPCIDTGDPNSPLDPDGTRADMGALYYDQSTVGIRDNQIGVPDECILFPAYPNPFNPLTTIRYQLPQAADVKLEIYNSLGQKVRTLVNSRVEAGYHQVDWGGRNEVNSKVASGVYFYHIQMGDFQDIKKMIFLK